jgi:superoxide reductase
MMVDLRDHFQSADWKSEKHMPVIDAPSTVKKGEVFDLQVEVGREVSHPNKTEHHIRWIAVYFHPEGEKSLHEIGRAEFAAHGGSTQGPAARSVCTNPSVELSFRTDKPGMIFASSFCNIHGLWMTSKKVSVV